MNSGCDECEQTFSSKICHENLGLYFCNPFQNFYSVLLKKLKINQNLRKKFWLGIVRLLTLHSRKNGWQKAKRSLKVGKQQHVPI